MAFPALLAGLIPTAIKGVVGIVKGFFGVKEKKLDLEVMKETNDRDLQIAWWEYLKNSSSTVVNQVIRPLTMLYFIGDFAYQRYITGTYKIVQIVPQFEIGDVNIGPITNGLILAFIILFLFPLRGIEKMILRKN